MSYAERNRHIKKVMEQAFGKGKVRVKGSRGTAYGWVSVHINYAPRNNREAQELRQQAMLLLNSKAETKVGTYGYDDPGSDYGYGQCIHINFDHCREQADYHGPEAWKHHLDAAKWDELQRQGVQA